MHPKATRGTARPKSQALSGKVLHSLHSLHSLLPLKSRQRPEHVFSGTHFARVRHLEEFLPGTTGIVALTQEGCGLRRGEICGPEVQKSGKDRTFWKAQKQGSGLGGGGGMVRTPKRPSSSMSITRTSGPRAPGKGVTRSSQAPWFAQHRDLSSGLMLIRRNTSAGKRHLSHLSCCRCRAQQGLWAARGGSGSRAPTLSQWQVLERGADLASSLKRLKKRH